MTDVAESLNLFSKDGTRYMYVYFTKKVSK